MTMFTLTMYFNNSFGKKTYCVAIITEHLILSLMILMTSYPTTKFDDFLKIESIEITKSLIDPNKIVIFGLILLLVMLIAFFVFLRTILNT